MLAACILASISSTSSAILSPDDGRFPIFHHYSVNPTQPSLIITAIAAAAGGGGGGGVGLVATDDNGW